MRVTVNQSGKPERVFTGIKQSTVNQYITSMSEFLTRAHIKVEDEVEVVKPATLPSLDEVLSKVRSLIESDHHAGEA